MQINAASCNYVFCFAYYALEIWKILKKNVHSMQNMQNTQNNIWKNTKNIVARWIIIAKCTSGAGAPDGLLVTGCRRRRRRRATGGVVTFVAVNRQDMSRGSGRRVVQGLVRADEWFKAWSELRGRPAHVLPAHARRLARRVTAGYVVLCAVSAPAHVLSRRDILPRHGALKDGTGIKGRHGH